MSAALANGRVAGLRLVRDCGFAVGDLLVLFRFPYQAGLKPRGRCGRRQGAEVGCLPLVIIRDISR